MTTTADDTETRVVDPADDSETSIRRIDLQRPVLAVISVIIGAFATRAAVGQLPRHLSGTSTIVGYPTYADFDVNWYFQTFHRVVLVTSLVSAAVYFGVRQLLRVAGLRPFTITLTAEPERPPRPSPRRDSAMQLGRVLVVGTVLGLEVAIVVDRFNPSVTIFAVAVLYCAGVGFLAFLGSRFSDGVTEKVVVHRTAVNAALVPLTIGALAIVSSNTGVRITGSNAFRAYPWFSPGLAALIGVAAAAWIGILIGRARNRDDLAQIERRAVVYGAVPVGVFLLTAGIAGDLGHMDMFHEGETLGASQLVSTGHFPWRDFAFIHGPLYDIFRSLLGIKVLESSRWGAAAGETLLLIPLFWVLLYFFAARVFRHNWAAILAGVCFVAAGLSTPIVHERFMLWPIVLLALGWMIDEPSWTRCTAFMFTLTLSVVLVPETVYGIVACAPVILLFDIIRYRRGISEHLLPRSVRCIVSGLVGSALWLGYLAINGALGHYITDLLAFRSDHAITGGIPVQWNGSTYFPIAIFLPVVGILIGIWYLLARLGRLRQLDAIDGMLIAALLMGLLYYGKFLARADGHVYGSLEATIPLLLILLAKGLAWIEDRLRSSVTSPRLTRHSVTLVLIPLLLIAPNSILAHVDNVRFFFRPRATVPTEPKIGYATTAAFPEDTLHDLRSLLGTLLQPKEKLFDFTNEPGLFHYLLDYRPASRYYDVSMAIARDAQQRLIGDLEASKPRLVVYDEPDFGLPVWDGVTNAVRHFDVSQYLLDNYKPLLFLRGFVFMIRDDIDPATLPPPPDDLIAKPVYDDLYFRTRTCDWGYTPSFLKVPVNTSGAVPLQLTVTSLNAVQLNIPPDIRLADYRWIEIDSGQSVPRTTFHLRATDQPDDEFHRMTFGSAGLKQTSLRVQVGACPVWHVGDDSTLILSSTAPVSISSVRLIP